MRLLLVAVAGAVVVGGGGGGGIPGVNGQTLTCPTSIAKPANFLVIGGSGGDSLTACENTAAATTAGLTAGMNAVELDISLSKDLVVFLWNDPVPLDPGSVARSKGLFVNGLCRPQFKTIKTARELVYSAIKRNYIYVDADGNNKEATIPTLTEWMDVFAANAQLERIYIDVKEIDVSVAGYIVDYIFDKANSLGVASKIRLLCSDYSMTGALQTALGKRGLTTNIASRTFGGEIGSVHIGDASEFNPVSEASTECYDTAAVGQTASTWSWRGYQNILTRMLASRDTIMTESGRYHAVVAWRVNDVQKIAWLICAGVDGIITDQVGKLNNLNLRKTMNLISCCTEEDKLPCLPRFDPRIAGQGCSTKGINWNDAVTEQCPLFDLDILYTGVRLTCKKQSFCQV